MLERLTVKQLKTILKEVPDDAIVCCQSDEEGNRTMVCYDASYQTVGEKKVLEFDGEQYDFIGGDEIEGIDLEKDKGKTCLIIHPLY